MEDFSSPHHALYKCLPDYKFLKIFGCACFPLLRPYNQHKLQFRSCECVYLGVSPSHKGHKCLAPNGRIYISKDVTFNESKFPFPYLFPTTSSQLSTSSPSFPAAIPLIPNSSPSTPSSTPSHVPITESMSSPSSSSLPTASSPAIPLDIPSAVPPPLNTHPMVTRSKTGSLKPRIFLAHVEPKSVKEALSSPNWFSAMQAEHDALLKNNTWSLVPLPPNRKAIGCKWVFRIKENSDGSINKYKARLVAKGFHQLPGFDFTETFSPVIKPVTIRIILTLALTNKWVVQQIDINNAFLNGLLTEEIYMVQPPGFESSDKSLVCRLHKALYGLKQAPRAWYERLTTTLLQFGFKSSRCDPSLFVYSKDHTCIFVLIYVDDILITGSCPSLVQNLIDKLDTQFALKQLGQLDYFLGVEVKHLPGGALLMTQSKYIRELLARANMSDSKGISSPMPASCKLSKIGTDTVSDPHHFRSIVGALQYATLTRPDIAYSVNKVCQFMANPLESHWKAVKRILRYLKGSQHLGLVLKPASVGNSYSLVAYSDADWANDPDDRRSTSGSCIFLGPNLVSWSSKKQNLVARSSTEAEYRGMAHTTAELLWIKSLLTELGVSFTTPQLLCDNLSAVSLSHNPVLHARTKHMELDIHFVREKVVAKALQVRHIPAQDQIADTFTKPLSTPRFCDLRTKLNVLTFQQQP